MSLTKRKFHTPSAMFHGADGLSTQVAPDGSTIMVDTTTGAYQEDDGSWYALDGTPLSYYDPATGNYVEQGDSSLTMYDKNGNPVGTASAGPGGTAAAPKSSGGFWSSLLSAATSLGGASKPATTTTGITPVYKPSVTTNTGGLIVAVLVIGAVVTASVIIIRKSKKK